MRIPGLRPALASVLFASLVPACAGAEECVAPPAWALSCASPARSVEIFYSVALDGKGGTVAVGLEARPDRREEQNWLIVRADLHGTVLWSTSYDDPDHGDDVAQGVAADGAGNFAVAGWEERNDLGQYANWLVRCYDAAGQLAWSASFDGPGHGDDRAQAVCLDRKGAVVAAGWQSSPAGVKSMLVRKYDSRGRLAWSRSSPGGTGTLAYGVASDGAGNVITAGCLQRGGFDRDWLVRKYDGAGRLLWSRTRGGPGWDEAQAVAALPDGSTVVAGKEQEAGPGGVFSWLVVRFSPGGETVWSLTWASPGGGDAKAFGAGSDACGRVLVAGCADGDPAARKGRGDWRAVLFGPAGEILCSITSTGACASPSGALGAALDCSGRAALAGLAAPVPGSNDFDAALAGYLLPPGSPPPGGGPVKPGAAKTGKGGKTGKR